MRGELSDRHIAIKPTLGGLAPSRIRSLQEIAENKRQTKRSHLALCSSTSKAVFTRALCCNLPRMGQLNLFIRQRPEARCISAAVLMSLSERALEAVSRQL